MSRYGYVYILASRSKRLYIGVTAHLERRIWQHQNKTDPNCFTAKYNINQLVWYETYGLVSAAIAREKELKGWLRVRKVALIVASNPTWKDLSAAWGEPLRLINESSNRSSDAARAPTRLQDTEILRFAQDDGP